MGGGGLMQLVAYGMQDVYLTGNSQITFFKNLYRRHTNFSCEAVEQTFQSNSKNLGNKLVAVISRNGDLLHRLWLEVDIEAPPSNAQYVSKLGHTLIKSAEVEIGGQRIDKIYGRFCHLWHKLSCKAEKEPGYELMTGNDGPDKYATDDLYAGNRKLYIPLHFWFSKGSAGAALPLIALQYHEVRVTIELASDEEVLRGLTEEKSRKVETQYLLTENVYDDTPELSVGGEFVGTVSMSDSTSSPLSVGKTLIDEVFRSTRYTPKEYSGDGVGLRANPRLYSDFFYLDTDERRRFSQMSHEYLIEQLQFTGSEVTPSLKSTSETSFSTRINFNHPCKAIYWTTERTDTANKSMNPFYNGWRKDEPPDQALHMIRGLYGKYHDNSPISSVQLQLNGHERFSVRDGSYFHTVQPYQHHTRVPYDHWLGMYSFCLSPEEHQPSGALNFSRIDNASLKLTFKKTESGESTRSVYVYAVNYNVLRILSGMGGLAFSN